MTRGDKKYLRKVAAHVRKHPGEAETWLEQAFERGRKRRVTMAIGTMMVSVCLLLQLLLCAVEH